MNIRLLRLALVTSTLAFAAAVVLLLILATVACRLPDPDLLVAPSAYAALILSGFGCGLATATLNGEAQLLSGVASGVALTLIIRGASLVCMLVCHETQSLFPGVALSSLIPLASSILGGAVGLLPTITGSAAAHSKRGHLRSARAAARRVGYYNR